jgi:CheY-like chemotaxis protein
MPKRILIVDDEPQLILALSHKLTHDGYQVSSAHNGRECLDTLAKQNFDLILLDLVMPIMDGFETLKRLRTKPNTPPIIALSNLGQKEDKDRALGLGAKEFLIKSNTPLAEIVERAEKHL